MTLSAIDEYKPLFDAPVKQWQNGLVDSVQVMVTGSLFFLTSNFFSLQLFLYIFSCFLNIPFYLYYLNSYYYFSIERLVMSSYI